MLFPLFKRRTVLATALALLAAAPALAQSIAGRYQAEGRNPDGSSYKGSVVISDQGGRIQMNWTVGASKYSGSGSRNGDVIWIDWGDQYPVVYVRMPNGELHGTWANGRALERLFR